MSSKPIVAALLVAIVLAVAVLGVVMYNRANAARGPLIAAPAGVEARAVPIGDLVLPFDAGSVRSIELLPSDGRRQRLVFHPSSGQWTYQERNWPVEPDAVAAALALLKDARAQAVPTATSAQGAGRTELVLRDAAGAELARYRLASRTLAGQGLLEALPAPGTSGPIRAAIVRSAVHERFNAGFLPWRQTLLFPTATRATGVTFWRQDPDAAPDAQPVAAPDAKPAARTPRRITIAGRGARWALTEPLAAPAEPEAVARTLSTLASLRVGRFIDSPWPTPAQAGLDAPRASLVLTLPPTVPDSSPVQHTLRLGARADDAGRTLYASLDGSDAIFVVDAALIEQLPVLPEPFIARASLDAEPADIRALRLTVSGAASAEPAPPPAFTRTPVGWAELTDAPGAAEPATVLLSPQRAATVDEVAVFLTKAAAVEVRSAALPAEEATPLGTITAELIEHRGSVMIPVARTADNRFVLTVGGIARVYQAAPPLLRQTFLVAAPTAQPSPPVPQPPSGEK